MKGIRAVDFTTAEYPRVGYDEAALAALSKMLGEERDYAMVVEQGDIVGALERKELVFLYGRGELDGSTLVSRVARDLPWIDSDATFDDVVRFMAVHDVFQVCIDNRVLDDLMLLRAIWSERVAVAREFREYEEPKEKACQTLPDRQRRAGHGPAGKRWWGMLTPKPSWRSLDADASWRWPRASWTRVWPGQ